MLARLLGLSAVTLAATIGIAAQVVIVPGHFLGIELPRRVSERHTNWETTPTLNASPRRHERAS